MKKLVLCLSLILMLSFSSAHDGNYKEWFVEAKYFPEDRLVVSKTVWVNYDNADRFSTYDYRHGYSYRASRDYFDRKVKNIEVKPRSYEGHRLKSYDYDKRHLNAYDYDGRYDSRYFDSGRKGYRYEYVSHLRSYERRDCYLTPPADKLFYIAC